MAKLEAEHDVTVEWLPYELRPEPVPLPDMNGPDLERFRQGWARGVGPLAERYGVEMSFPSTKPRSRKAHEAAEYAREHGAFEAMRVGLFRAFFVDDRDIDDVDVLVSVGAGVGLDAAELRDALTSGHYGDRVAALELVSARIGVRAVPTMIIGELAVEGAQPYEVLKQVLAKAEATPTR